MPFIGTTQIREIRANEENPVGFGIATRKLQDDQIATCRLQSLKIICPSQRDLKLATGGINYFFRR
jgi:hypothetical protein